MSDGHDLMDPCPGPGLCHGTQRWCNECGDVGDVCDFRPGCDVHGRDSREGER